MNFEEEIAVLKQKVNLQEQRIQAMEDIIKKALSLVKGQNDVVQKLAEAVAAILKKMAEG